MTNHSEILRRWQLLSPYLDRRLQTLWAAAEAEVIGRDGHQLLARVTGIKPPMISYRRRQVRLTGTAQAGSLVRPKRASGAGRKAVEVNDPEIEPALQKMLSEEIAGDPMGPQRWGTQQPPKPQQAPWRARPSSLHSHSRPAAPQNGILVASCQEKAGGSTASRP
jgi:hypothetical protein